MLTFHNADSCPFENNLEKVVDIADDQVLNFEVFIYSRQDGAAVIVEESRLRRSYSTFVGWKPTC